MQLCRVTVARVNLQQHLAALPPVAIIYSDLDGTLLGRDGSVLADAAGRPTLSTVTALVEARRAGLAVVAVSGRRASQLSVDARILGLDGAIAEAGAVTIHDGELDVVWGRCPSDLAPTPRQAMEAVGALQVVLEAFPGAVRPYRPWDADRMGGYLLHGLLDTVEANERLEAAGIAWAHVVDNGVTGGWPERDVVHAYHLLARGVGKAAGVEADLRRRGIDPRAAVSIGDSVEDQTMAAVTGTYVMVANGHGEEGGNRFRAEGRNGAGVAEVIGAALAARGAGSAA